MNSPAATPEPAAVSLSELHERAQRKVCMATYRNLGIQYDRLRFRFESVSRAPQSPAAKQLAADLQAMLNAEDAALKRMALNRWTDLNGRVDGARDTMAAQQAAHIAAVSKPPPAPAEVLQSLRVRGFTVTAAGDVLHVAPAAKLTEADRRTIAANKAGIIAALSDAVATF